MQEGITILTLINADFYDHAERKNEK